MTNRWIAYILILTQTLQAWADPTLSAATQAEVQANLEESKQILEDASASQDPAKISRIKASTQKIKDLISRVSSEYGSKTNQDAILKNAALYNKYGSLLPSSKAYLKKQMPQWVFGTWGFWVGTVAFNYASALTEKDPILKELAMDALRDPMAQSGMIVFSAFSGVTQQTLMSGLKKRPGALAGSIPMIVGMLGQTMLVDRFAHNEGWKILKTTIKEAGWMSWYGKSKELTLAQNELEAIEEALKTVQSPEAKGQLQSKQAEAKQKVEYLDAKCSYFREQYRAALDQIFIRSFVMNPEELHQLTKSMVRMFLATLATHWGVDNIMRGVAWGARKSKDLAMNTFDSVIQRDADALFSSLSAEQKALFNKLQSEYAGKADEFAAFLEKGTKTAFQSKKSIQDAKEIIGARKAVYDSFYRQQWRLRTLRQIDDFLASPNGIPTFIQLGRQTSNTLFGWTKNSELLGFLGRTGKAIGTKTVRLLPFVTQTVLTAWGLMKFMYVDHFLGRKLGQLAFAARGHSDVMVSLLGIDSLRALLEEKKAQLIDVSKRYVNGKSESVYFLQMIQAALREYHEIWGRYRSEVIMADFMGHYASWFGYLNKGAEELYKTEHYLRWLARSAEKTGSIDLQDPDFMLNGTSDEAQLAPFQALLSTPGSPLANYEPKGPWHPPFENEKTLKEEIDRYLKFYGEFEKGNPLTTARAERLIKTLKFNFERSRSLHLKEFQKVVSPILDDLKDKAATPMSVRIVSGEKQPFNIDDSYLAEMKELGGAFLKLSADLGGQSRGALFKAQLEHILKVNRLSEDGNFLMNSFIPTVDYAKSVKTLFVAKDRSQQNSQEDRSEFIAILFMSAFSDILSERDFTAEKFEFLKTADEPLPRPGNMITVGASSTGPSRILEKPLEDSLGLDPMELNTCEGPECQDWIKESGERP